jgi:dihydrofolate reductase
MIVSMIAAIAKNNVIGKDNQLIWNLPKDMKFFMDSTMNRHIIMGRKNYESIPIKYRPLKNRVNIIVTRNSAFKADNCIVVSSILDGLKFAKEKGESECFIIGGGQIYQHALDQEIVDKLYLTHINSDFDGDTFFPNINYKKWSSKLLFSNAADERNPHDFKVIEYSKKI